MKLANLVLPGNNFQFANTYQNQAKVLYELRNLFLLQQQFCPAKYDKSLHRRFIKYVEHGIQRAEENYPEVAPIIRLTRGPSTLLITHKK